MMLYPAMSLLNKYVENRYLLVNVVARRARQIAEQQKTGERKRKADERGVSPLRKAGHHGHQRGRCR